METMQIIGQLEAVGVNLALAIDYEGTITPDAERLLQALSSDREAAIDVLAGRRFSPLPDGTAHPFRSDHEKRIGAIFRTAYNLLVKYEGAASEADWKAIHNYHEGRLDPADALAVDVFIASVSELMRKYKNERDAKQ